MKQRIWYAVMSILLCGIGYLFFLYQESWIIFISPFQEQVHHEISREVVYKKVTLYMWYKNEYKMEHTEIMYSDDYSLTLKCLLSNWLRFLEDETQSQKQTEIESVILSHSQQEAFISLNQNPFEEKDTTFDKMMWMESLLKTIRANKIPIASVRVLVHHQPLVDDHLQFALSWPVVGFRESL